MIEQLPRHGRNYDWNVGSIIRYFESELILDAIDLAGGAGTVRDSMGVAWALGEAEGSSFSCRKTLRFIVECTENHEAWRLAAHSLSSKASDLTPVDIMLHSLNSIGCFEPLDYCLSDLGDSRSACGVLMHRSCPHASCAVAEAVARCFYDGCPDHAVLRNCCWLSEQMALQDDGILKGLVDCAKSDDYDLRHAAITAIGSYPDGLGAGILRVLSQSEDDLSRRLATRYLHV